MTKVREHKWHVIISTEAGYVFKIIKIHYGARSDRMFLLNMELLPVLLQEQNSLLGC